LEIRSSWHKTSRQQLSDIIKVEVEVKGVTGVGQVAHKHTHRGHLWCISRSEQAPGSEFHPRDKSENNDCGFLGPSWCCKKVIPQTYVPCGSYELLLSNVAHEMKEK
jgi:hypothetical protein